MTENSLQGEMICFIFPEMSKVKSSAVGCTMEKIQLFILDIAVYRRNHSAKNRISFIVILLKPEPEIIRKGLHNFSVLLS